MNHGTEEQSAVVDASPTVPSPDLPDVHQDLLAYSARGGRLSVKVPPRPLTETELSDWIAKARVGEAIQYHTGLLWRDQAEASGRLSADERTHLKAVARQAREACELGLVHLFSHRSDDGQFRYFAIRSSYTPYPLDMPAPDHRAMSDTPIPVSN